VGAAEVLTDDQLDELVGRYVVAAGRAQEAGFDFVDVKHCHGYLLHELLTGVDRPGRYGGDFEGRTRFLREVVAGIRSEAPGLAIGGAAFRL
jgi:NADPH2 dehydrogenase